MEFPASIPTVYVATACTAMSTVIGWLLLERRELIRDLKAATARHIELLTKLVEKRRGS